MQLPAIAPILSPRTSRTVVSRLATAAAFLVGPAILAGQQPIITIDLSANTTTLSSTDTSAVGAAGTATTIVLTNLPDTSKQIGLRLQWTGGSRVLDNAFLRKRANGGSVQIPVSAAGEFPGPNGQEKLERPFAVRAFVGGVDVTGVSGLGGSTARPRSAAATGDDAGEGYLRSKRGNQIARPYAGDTVRLFFNADGRRVGVMPRNVDQDDSFILTIVARRSQLRLYDVRIDEGEYAPSDLSLRPADALKADIAKAQSTGGAPPEDPWDLLEFRYGPFTTTNFKFTITYGDTVSSEVKNLRSYAVRINPLYHVGFGVTLLKSQLADPSFDVVPIRSGSDTTTIRAIDDSDRGLVSLNVIWYWRIFHRDFWTGGGLTRGRDVLKETRLIDRIFPTIGVSINEKLTDNFFYGGVFEFARGGSIAAGRHYGKVQTLADPNFVLGTTPFTGAKADIKTSTVWKSDWFVGVTMDTRVLNSLFGLGGTGGGN